VIEGEWPGRCVIRKFPSAEKARAWHDSPEYHDVRKIRWECSVDNMGLFSGFDLETGGENGVEGTLRVEDRERRFLRESERNFGLMPSPKRLLTIRCLILASRPDAIRLSVVSAAN
jgi:hypothetical protein